MVKKNIQRNSLKEFTWWKWNAKRHNIVVECVALQYFFQFYCRSRSCVAFQSWGLQTNPQLKGVLCRLLTISANIFQRWKIFKKISLLTISANIFQLWKNVPNWAANWKFCRPGAINKPRASLNGLAGHHFIALRYRDNFLRSCCLPPPTPPPATDNPLSSQQAASVYQTDHYVPSGASYLNPLMVIMENLYQPTHWLLLGPSQKISYICTLCDCSLYNVHDSFSSFNLLLLNSCVHDERLISQENKKAFTLCDVPPWFL